jgi:hypothetical protein
MFIIIFLKNNYFLLDLIFIKKIIKVKFKKKLKPVFKPTGFGSVRFFPVWLGFFWFCSVFSILARFFNLARFFTGLARFFVWVQFNFSVLGL